MRVNKRTERPASKGGPIDPATGKNIYVETGETYIRRTVNKKTGAVTEKVVPVTIKSVRLAETDDAHTLSSGTTIEKVYGDHSNRLKAMANEARLAALNTKTTPYSPSAKAAYSKEVASLNAKLNIALRNRPLERQAQVVANTVVAAKRQANPDMDAAELKKIKGQALTEARSRVGASKTQVHITESEWAAIQAGAISNNTLSKILDNADLDQVKKLATPKTEVLMTSVKQKRADAMLKSGYTQAEVADALGVSLTTLKNTMNEGA